MGWSGPLRSTHCGGATQPFRLRWQHVGIAVLCVPKPALLLLRRPTTQVIDTNLTAAFHVARESYRLMARQQPQGGRIINNGSVSAQVEQHPWTALTRGCTLTMGCTD